MIFRYKTLKEKLTMENAKEIYYYSKYNIFGATLDFYYENFTNEVFLKWNDEYINKELDICESYFYEEISLTTLAKHVHNFSYLVEVFTNNKETYKRMIQHLKRLYAEYGYFFSYSFDDPFNRRFDWGPSEFGRFIGIYLGRLHQRSIDKEKKYFDSVYYFYPQYYFCGLIHNINMCGFKDVLNDLLVNITLPLFENYQKQEYFKDYKIRYFHENDNNIKKYRDYNVLRDYILIFNIDAPKRLKEILEIE